MSLLDIINNKSLSDKLSKEFNDKLASKNFWKEDEENYILTQNKIDTAHKSIIMTHEKYHSVFYCL
jgi:hypothetical protein